jgi:hypothetical protein
MKLFQIEEPDGSPGEAEGPGAAVGIEIHRDRGAAVAVAVGGNAELLRGADGEARLALAPPGDDELTTLFLRLRERAEKALARPVTHAVVVSDGRDESGLRQGAAAAGLELLRLIDAKHAAALAPEGGADAAVMGAAIQAEDDAAPFFR